MKSTLLRALGGLIVLLGLAAMALGSIWAPPTLEWVYGVPIVFPFDLLVPFAPIFAIALGTGLWVRSRS